MPKLIDADKLKAHYAWWDNEDKKIFDTIVDLQSIVDAVPLEDYKSMEQTVNKLTKAIADAEPVKHGHWIKANDPMSSPFDTMKRCLCSECREWATVTSYCPNCGARMDEEDV